MRFALALLLMACDGVAPALDAGTLAPCGCDAAAAAEGRLCRRVSQLELDQSRGEVGPGWETCPPAPAD